MDPSELLVRTWHVLLALLPTVLWCAFWLWAVNWKTAWQVLAQGGWAPLLVLAVAVPAVWAQIDAGGFAVSDSVTIPRFWWQFIAVLTWLGLALFCGGLQGYFHYTPVAIELEPPPVAHGHDHN
jgi:hypothetical protein